MLKDIKHNIFPRAFEDIAVKGESLIGVEIGVYTGLHAESLLKHLDMERLYLVDPYECYDEYPEGDKSWGEGLPSVEESAIEAIEKIGSHPNVKWLTIMSDEAVEFIPDGLDFVYIDGNHSEEYVSKDIELYWPKLKKGGVIGGHDFYNGFCRDHDGVITAVIKFVSRENLQLHLELPDWWVINGIP